MKAKENKKVFLCEKCNKEVEENAKFCVHCGAQFQDGVDLDNPSMVDSEKNGYDFSNVSKKDVERAIDINEIIIDIMYICCVIYSVAVFIISIVESSSENYYSIVNGIINIFANILLTIFITRILKWLSYALYKSK